MVLPIVGAYYAIATANLSFSIIGKGFNNFVFKPLSGGWNWISNKEGKDNEKKLKFQREVAKIQAKQQIIVQKHRQEFDAKQAALSREFQAEQAEINREFQVSLEAYRQQFDLHKFETRLDFEKALAEERRRLDVELQQKSQQFSVEMAFLQAELNRETESYRRFLNAFPLQLPPDSFINDYSHYLNNGYPVPPMVLVSPPDLNFEKNSSKAKVGLPEEIKAIAKSIEESLRVFLNSSYADKTKRPIKFYGGAWETKKSSGETAVTALHNVLSNIPTIILESEAEGEVLNFRVFFWDMDQRDFNSFAVLSDFNYMDFVYDVERRRAQAWQVERERLLAKGYPPEEVAQIGGQREINLQLLAKERRYKEDGVDYEVQYKPTKDGIEELPKFLKLMHCLTTGMILDAYYLMRYQQYPKMPELLGGLVSGMGQDDAVYLVDILASHLRVLCDQLKENQLQALIPNGAIGFAKQFAQLPNAIGMAAARDFLIVGLTAWLGVPLSSDLDENALLEKVKDRLTFFDVGFSQHLNGCLTALSYQGLLDVESACLNRGITRFQRGEFDIALTDFDQVIYLNPNSSQAYFQRGLTYQKLDREESIPNALADFQKAVELQPDYAMAHNLLGDIYLKMENYELSIASYNRAVELGLNIAIKKRDAATDIWHDKQREEEESRERFENFLLSANEKFHTQNYQDAISDFNEAIKIHPDFEDVYFLRGLSKYFVKDYQGAINDFELGFKYDCEEEAIIYLYCGYSRFFLKEFQGAASDLDRCISLQNGIADDPETYLIRSGAKFLIEDYRGVISDFEDLLKLQPDLIDSIFQESPLCFLCASSKLLLKDYQGAIYIYDKLMRLKKDDNYKTILNLLRKELPKYRPDEITLFLEQVKQAARESILQGTGL